MKLNLLKIRKPTLTVLQLSAYTYICNFNSFFQNSFQKYSIYLGELQISTQKVIFFTLKKNNLMINSQAHFTLHDSCFVFA